MLRLYNSNFNFIQQLFTPSYDLFVENTFSPVQLATECKLSPAFSVGFGIKNGYRSTVYFDLLRTGGSSIGKKTMATFATIRWYYQMANRIKKGLSASNFSGNYIGFQLSGNIFQKRDEFQNAKILGGNSSRKWITEYHFEKLKRNVELRFGIQRRFLRNGIIDFGIDVGMDTYERLSQNIIFKNGDNNIYQGGSGFDRIESVMITKRDDRNKWYINTNLKAGLAIGDFKKRKKEPLCDVFRCFEDEKSMIKITWPSITVGQNNQSALMSFAYEYKIGESPFSINN